ncbi:hypothetical protein [Tautonia plasticadhaerens]|uniref:Uncharacterized protein n=1 Tax=Tautonia plasticadhaerens TaxID=2527974 RepID=A0A518H412_9BACT|nr:hypothetical protein [Tautonia plasticadhaerens]QDV35569.1 hypothetical protein ElP_34730 [Tautonia plasticadhaerens]
METDAEIEALVRSFEELTLPRARWTHRAHLVAALWYLRRYPREDATRRIREGIKAFNARHGVGSGYHETVTLAWVAVVARFLTEHDRGQPLPTLTAALLEACGGKDHLLVYYTEGVLMSEEARRTWVPPDLRPIEADDLNGVESRT